MKSNRFGNHTLATTCLGLLGVALAALIGCAQKPTDESSAATSSEYLLTDEPAEALEVIAAREQAQDGGEVVLVGRIGGSVDPWVKDRAAFTLVDNSLEACSDIPGDQCKSPWDYCCRTDALPTSTALIKVMDGSGELVAKDARDLLGVKELDRVVVHGKASRDEDGNLTVLADGVYVTK